MITFQQATELLAKRAIRRLANNTYLQQEAPNECVIRLHSNPIVTIHRDGSYKLSSCGWRTNTTKSRINQYSPVGVSQVKGVWYIETIEGGRVIFTDGIRVTA